MKKGKLKVWAFELCYCKYETGYTVRSLHSTKEQAEVAMNKKKKEDSGFLADGYRVTQWEVESCLK